jgi:hypothetical protein
MTVDHTPFSLVSVGILPFLSASWVFLLPLQCSQDTIRGHYTSYSIHATWVVSSKWMASNSNYPLMIPMPISSSTLPWALAPNIT